MKKVIHKLFWVWDFDKEERWLNDMAAQGLVLTDVSFCRYVFEVRPEESFTLRLELLEELPIHPKSAAYIRFIEDTGAEYIGSLLRWAYFRKRAEDGPFDLFSDIDSRVRHLWRMFLLLFIPCVAIGLNAINLFVQYAIRNHNGFQLSFAIVSAALSVWMLFGVLSIHRKIRRLKKERFLRE